ncbi:cysteine desulfurase family protein [Nanoarchaeota archaeon]
MKNIYMDNSATTKVADEVVEEMNLYFSDRFGNASSLHDFGQEAFNSLEKARKIIADRLNCEDSHEIIFTSGGTESDNLAIMGIAFANKDKGNHIITSKIEHPAVLNTCSQLEKEFGFKITYLDVDKEGLIDIEQLKKEISDETILVTIIHGNNEIGTIQKIEEVAKICREKDIYFHTDAVQSFTKVDIDVQKIKCDLLSLTAHKIHGPKGIGALYVKNGTKILPMLKGGRQERCLRPGTENIAGINGFAKCVEISSDEHVIKMKELRDYFINEIREKIPEVNLNGPIEGRLCNNINFNFKYIEGEALLLKLNEEGIAVSTGSACSSRSLKPSHVLMALGLRPQDCHGSIRFTISRYTSKEEIDFVVEKLVEIVKDLRKISPLYKGGS